MTATAAKGTGRRWIVRLLLTGSALVCLLCAAGASHYAVRQHEGRREALDAALSDLRARGEPVDVDDLVPPLVPPEEDGGPLLREAWAHLASQGEEGELVPPEAGISQQDFDALPAERREELRAASEAFAPCVELVVRALERPRWRPLDSDEVQVAAARTEREVSELQRTSHVVALAVCALPDDASPETRGRLLGSLARLGARWEAPQTSVQWLVATTLQSRALERAREQLELGRIEPADVRRDFADVLDADIRARADRVLRIERAVMIDLVRRMIGDDPRPVLADRSVPVVGEGWLARLSRASLIEYLDEMASLIEDPSRSWTSLARRARQLEPTGELSLWKADLGSALTRSSTTLLPRIVAAEVRLATRQRLTLCALAALAHRDRTGGWPASLDALGVPADVRVDPYTSAALVYELSSEGGLRIASVGPVDPAVWGERAAVKNDPAADGLVWHLR